jgi:hypothetical protein
VGRTLRPLEVVDSVPLALVAAVTRARTEDVGGELAEADVAAPAGLAVVQDARHEGVLVEGDGGHDGERGEAERPPHPAQRVGQRQHRRPHDRRRQVEPGVPPRPCERSDESPRNPIERTARRKEKHGRGEGSRTLGLEYEGGAGVGLGRERRLGAAAVAPGFGV